MSEPPSIDIARCEALVEKTCAGDESAWRGLVELLWPHWLGLVRGSRHMGPLARSEDHVHNVLANLVDKLGTDGGRAITTFPKWKADNEGKTFVDWMRIVTSFTVTDYVRQVLGRGGKATEKDAALPSIKRLLNEFSTSPVAEDAYGSTRPPMTAAQTARELLEYARAELPEQQLKALSMWLDGASFEEIEEAIAPASSASGEEDAAKKLVRAAIAVLRRRFVVASTR